MAFMRIDNTIMNVSLAIGEYKNTQKKNLLTFLFLLYSCGKNLVNTVCRRLGSAIVCKDCS